MDSREEEKSAMSSYFSANQHFHMLYEMKAATYFHISRYMQKEREWNE